MVDPELLRQGERRDGIQAGAILWPLALFVIAGAVLALWLG